MTSKKSLFVGKEKSTRKRSIWSNGEDGPPEGPKHAQLEPDLDALANKLGIFENWGVW